MEFTQLLREYSYILMEGALGERLKREYEITFDEQIAMAGLIYQETGALALTELWNQYMDIARRYQFPFIATTPTRRANRERIAASDYSEQIIADNVTFLKNIQKKSGIPMCIGGLMGCKGDAYTGAGALTENEAELFHAWTAERFCGAQVDFLYAGIMPTLPEAAGLAKAVDQTNVPYIISFTIMPNGRLIDGTTIADAISYIDHVTRNQPVCYMANCVYPGIVYEALSQPWNDCEMVKARFRGIQANTSPLSYAELEHAKELHNSEPEAFAEDMVKLLKIADIRIWGGCCGTDQRYMEQVAKRIRERKKSRS